MSYFLLPRIGTFGTVLFRTTGIRPNTIACERPEKHPGKRPLYIFAIYLQTKLW
jgi:hypothetical protein